MPIVFIHGVAVRDRTAFPGIEMLLRQFVAPEISSDPAHVKVIPAYWGDRAATFAWDLASLPAIVAAMGAAGATSLERTMALVSAGPVPVSAPAPIVDPAFAGAVPMGAAAPVAAKPVVPPTLPVDDVIDLLCAGVAQQLAGEDAPAKVETAMHTADYAQAAIAIDIGVRMVAAGAAQLTLDTATLDKIRRQAQLANVELPPVAAFVTQGPDWVGRAITIARNKVGDAIQAAQDVVGDAIARALFGVRRPLNAFITTFVGDVFAYLFGRDATTGTGSGIVGVVLEALKEARAEQKARDGEKIVILSHSMGGQLTYDALTYYAGLDDDLKDLHVDLWVAAASQVGLFEELKLFKVSSAAYSSKTTMVPAIDPKRCARWWNVWDPNDFASYSAIKIIQGIDPDEEFKSDRNPLEAHGGYLVLPRFYRRIAEKLR